MEEEVASFEVRGNSVRAIVSLGKKQKLTQTFDTEKEARAWARGIERQKHLGQITATSQILFSDVISAYLPIAERKDSGRWEVIRLENYKNSALANIPLSQLTPAHLQDEFIEKRLYEVTGSTINRELNLLSAAFTYAVKVKKWITTNPVHALVRPPVGPPRNRSLLSALELDAIAVSGSYTSDCIPTSAVQRATACFFFALETGMRAGEILRVRPKDVNWDEKVLYVHALERGGRKGSKSGQIRADRWVPLTERAVLILKQLHESMPDDQVPMPNFSMPPYLAGLNDAQRDSAWRKVRDRSGVDDLRFHDTKHEAATRLCKFLDVIALSHAIGTKDIRLLRDTYYVRDPQEMAALLPASLSAHALK